MLKQIISEEKYQELMNLNLVNDIEEILSLKNSLIQIDINDIKYVLKGKLCAYFSGCYSNNIDLKIIDSHISPKRGLLFINSNDIIPLDEIEDLLVSIKNTKDIDLIYGMNLNSSAKSKLLVLLTGE